MTIPNPLRSMALAGLMLIAPGAAPASDPQETAPPPDAIRQALPTDEKPAFTLARIIEMLRSGTRPAAIAAMVEGSGAVFDVTVEDVIRLRKLGATPELIRILARGETPAAVAPDGAPESATEASASPDALTFRKVLRLHRKGTPAGELAALVASRGLRQTIDLDELIEARDRGLPAPVILALAGGGEGAAPIAGAPSAGGAAREAPRPIKVAEIRRMLEKQQEPSAIAENIARRGIAEPPTLDETLELRRLGATDEIFSAINDAAVAAESPEEEPDEDLLAEEPAEGGSAAAAGELPPPDSGETFTAWSVPAGAAVYVAPARTRVREAIQHGYLAGRTPLALSLPPGEYTVVIQKKAGDFEAGLLPAWRTAHDVAGTRSVLDNADLTFDPAACCLPGSLSGTVEVHPVPVDQPRVIIGDQFDGLPPFLFDGESLQILRVRKTVITHALKLYHVRKAAGQPRLLVATFVPAEGDPLLDEAVQGTASGRPFASLLESSELDYLGSASGLSSLAAALRVEAAHLGEGVAALGRRGAAILHQQIDGAFRLLTLSLDYGPRLRVTEQIVRPVDPFAPPPPPVKGKKKKSPPLPPPPPPLPGLERSVVPGLGAPRLAIENGSKAGLALLFSDGQFCFVPPSATREFVMDPGTFDLRILSSHSAGPAPQGRVHLSYHARYTMSIR